jgi:hypothetical protein
MLIEVIAVEEVHRPSVAGAKGPKPTDVTISDLSLHPRRFDGHLVRVRARVVFGLEGDNFLLDPFNDSMPFGDSATVWFYCKRENEKRVYGRMGVAGPGGIVLTGYFHYVRKTHMVNGAFDPGPLQFDAIDVSGTQLTLTGDCAH